ncbi:PREDICTED: protein SPT2 homolog [Dufourea novaeangliae]|uniref:Protein SPT2 homolog n=1 Tax=Dufourea novaeangliae TaxID=178035 RepID=A0A154PI92_DUFNO|nr:PREDICTED: protein SPT2 homolog [Dufourea novaeangliae]KZC11575.1 Protein SPT2 like protein [Dufourea novaeangliae]
MDFGTLLSVAQKNENSKQSIACYQSKFAPPKKPTKQAKALSHNIKKFLARKEEEEKQKVLEEKKKRENLLALRDHKAQSRINKHLKVCKAANKSAIADAIDNDNTAVTMAGPSQPDEDDYGYVSQEASAFYNQLMNKYNNAPCPKPLFSETRKKTVKDIASTKDRVKQALKQQEVEEALGHRRKRKSSGKEAEIQPEEKIENSEITDKNTQLEDKKERDEKPRAKKRPPPPPMDFNELLKIAEKKQYEPIVIDVKPKIEEPERLMTKKQMKEYAKEKEWRERKEQRSKVSTPSNKEGNTPTASKLIKTQDTRGTMNSFTKIPKLTESSISNKAPSKAAHVSESPLPKKIAEKSNENKSNLSKSNVSKTSEKDILLEERKQLESERRRLEEMRQAIEEEKKKLKLSKSKIEDVKNVKSEKLPTKVKVPERQIPSTSIKQKEGSAMNASKLRTALMSNGKVKQFPPTDMKPIRSKQPVPLKDHKKGLAVHKRRIHDEDKDDYDSELDDFIDDEVEENSEDYSKYISEIFGYDKSKYKYGNHEDDDDDRGMESSFAQQLKEEYVSTKIGIMEDLEDMRMEALEKKRKAMLKNKIKH